MHLLTVGGAYYIHKVEMLELSTGEVIETSEKFSDFWAFAIERHKVYMSRLRGESQPWTTDPIIGKYYFTNVFRAADRVSQELIRVQNEPGYSHDDVVFRTLLFKMFNLPSTFHHLDMVRGTSLGDFSVSHFSEILKSLMESGTQIFNGAYVIPNPSYYGADSKHENILRLIDDMMESGITYTVQNSGAEELYNTLISYNAIGPFLAYQLVTDLGYSDVSNFGENDFTVPGLGAVRGIAKCFPSASHKIYPEIIKSIATRWDDLHPQAHTVNLFGRKPTYIDVQNVFCETDKYTRVNKSTVGVVEKRMKRGYNPSGSSKIRDPFFPPKWGINENVKGYLNAI